MIHYTDPRQQGLGGPMPPRTRAPVELDADGWAWCSGCDLLVRPAPGYTGALCRCPGRERTKVRRCATEASSTR